MKKIIVSLLLILFIVTLTSCSTQIDDPDTDIDDKQTDNTDSIIDDSVLSKYDDDFLAKLDLALDEADEIRYMFGLTISVEGEMIKERYYNYSETDTTDNIFSVTKSVLSLLVGIALEKGFINSLEDSISDYIDLTEYENKEELSTIQLKHLLTMSAGLVWDSSNLSSEMIDLRSSQDPMGFILNRELGFTPGTEFNYSDGSAHLMSVILTEATGQETSDFALEYLFEPLGIEDPYWNQDQNDISIGGCDLYLSNEYLDRIGQLVLNKGVYNDKRIVSEEWIALSTSNEVSGVSYYGYYWWISSVRGYKLISAKGWAGQHIYIVPELDLVVTSSASGMISDAASGEQFDAIEEIIVYGIINKFTYEQ